MSQKSSHNSARVPVAMDPYAAVVDWLDPLSARLGVRSRGVLVSSLLRELMHDVSMDRPASDS